MQDATLLFIILALTMGLFISARWRYDIVAFLALMLAALVGVVPFHDTFTGFSNPAVVTVACVMVITHAITRSGIVDAIVSKLVPVTQNTLVHIAFLTLVTGVLSMFMNNIGALALMMPVAIQTARKSNRSSSLVLMPLAFGSALGGLCTAIGTPPNLLIAAYRQQVIGQPFYMFDFFPVGSVVALVGIVFIIFIGWRLIPIRRKVSKHTEDKFHIEDYIAELLIPEDSPVVGLTFGEVEKVSKAEFVVIGLIRNNRKRLAIQRSELIENGDIIIVECTHDELAKLVSDAKVKLVGQEHLTKDLLRSDDTQLMEAVVPVGSRVENRSIQSIGLRSRYHTNLLAISRKGKPFKQRISQVLLKPGDILLLQGEADSLREKIVSLGLLPLVQRDISVKKPSAAIPLVIFALAIIAAGAHWVPVQIAFAIALGLMVVSNIIPISKVYEGIDWSIIILLASMIPLGNALQTTGATDIITNWCLSLAGNLNPAYILVILLVITMTLSDIMNNAATAVIMAPIAVGIAHAMHLNPDTFLMTVSIGASCSFLTPIGHQNNTLVMGPGGYKFGDYIRLGLPVEIMVLVTAIPMLLWVWPI